MISALQLIRSVGQFDHVSARCASLSRLTLIYAENGRGKTTLAAILRSLATGDPIPITERRRLAARLHPHIVLDCDGAATAAVFQDGAWNRTLPNVAVFDDVFIDQNVYSGLAVDAEHRQNLHELILGARGVTLNQELQKLVQQTEQHNATLRTKAADIPEAARGTLSVDDFCALEPKEDIDEAIRTAERNFAAAREQDPIRKAGLFDGLRLPDFDVQAIRSILQEDLASLDAEALKRVQAHLARLGPGGEAWVAEGMSHLAQTAAGSGGTVCPFCAQSLSASPVMKHYRAYFSKAYANLKRRISQLIEETRRIHGGDAAAAFERAVRVAVERRQFWSRFCDVPDVAVDTETIVRDWRIAREAVISMLTAKQSAVLERTNLTQEAREAVATYAIHQQRLADLSKALEEANVAIRQVKKRAAEVSPQAIAENLSRLRAIKARYTPEVARLCGEYLAEFAAKRKTEQKRRQVRAALDEYRAKVFPGYKDAVNLYLQRFNAGFRIDSVTPVQTRAGATCTYNVLINNTPVPVGGGTPEPGKPSFRNTLSSGDRNTLALAFFFASLDQDPDLADKVVVIDDPVSSLDDHRSVTTVQEIRRLAGRTAQVIVLSHDKRFLCRIWEWAHRSTCTTLQIVRDGDGSGIRSWEAKEDSISDHDRRDAMFRKYLATGSDDSRGVAESIRPHLDAFLRVACPEYFPPGARLGGFHTLCKERVGTPQQILDADATDELGDLIEYGNRFHHDSNPAWETEVINDTELRGFVQRTLSFARR